MTSIDDLSSPARTQLWAAAALSGLVDHGFISGPKPITPSGIAAADQLDAAWKPSNEELFLCVTLSPLLSETPLPAKRYLYRLLIDWRDRRDEMIQWVEEHRRSPGSDDDG